MIASAEAGAAEIAHVTQQLTEAKRDQEDRERERDTQVKADTQVADLSAEVLDLGQVSVCVCA